MAEDGTSESSSLGAALSRSTTVTDRSSISSATTTLANGFASAQQFASPSFGGEGLALPSLNLPLPPTISTIKPTTRHGHDSSSYQSYSERERARGLEGEGQGEGDDDFEMVMKVDPHYDEEYQPSTSTTTSEADTDFKMEV